MNHFRIFLSGSTGDFGSVRLRLREGLARGGCDVIHQADFPQTQADTVLKLAQLIEPCGVIIHLVGRQLGSVADDAAVAEYLAVADKGGIFLAQHAKIQAALGDFSGITYTQWEVLIALHLGRAVLVYGDTTHRDATHPQRLHLDRLITARRYPETFRDESDLYLKVMADLLAHYRQRFSPADLPAAFRPSNLPGGYIGRLFMGRDAFLDDLRSSLLRQGHQLGGGATAITQAPAATGISGLGGIGKTHTAVEYAHRHRADYSALLFVSGDSPERFNASLASLSGVLGLDAQDHLPPEESARVTATLNWLAKNSGWLLIVDNVENEPAAKVLTALLDRLINGHILITSRLHEWPDNIQSIEIEVLTPEAATDLLLALTIKRRPASDDAAQARILADLMAGLPLALHQAAGYINEQRLTVAGYLAIYQQEAAQLLGWFSDLRIPYERPDKLAPRPVLITWKTSFDKLEPNTRCWLLVFSHFSPDPIPEFLLDSPPEARSETQAHHHTARLALAQAEKYCLLTRDSGEPRFKIHRLVQQIVRLTTPSEACVEAIRVAIQLIKDHDPGDPDDVNTWEKWLPLRPHAMLLCAHAPDKPASENLCWLLSATALLLNALALYSEAELLHRRALLVAETNLGLNHPHISIYLNNLGCELMETSQLTEAEALCRRALAIDEMYYGLFHPDVAVDLNNLGALLKKTNRLEEAERHFRRALAINESCFGPANPNVAIDLHNLGLLLYERCEFEQAESLMVRALKMDIEAYGESHPRVASRLSSLGLLFQQTSRLDQAESFLRRALDIDESHYGKDHPTVAIRLSNIAVLLDTTNRAGEAEPLMRRALIIDETSFSDHHPNVAIRLNNLARLLQATNRLAEAEPLMRRAFNIFVASLGLEHPHSRGAGNNYISLLRAMKFGDDEIQRRLSDRDGG